MGSAWVANIAVSSANVPIVVSLVVKHELKEKTSPVPVAARSKAWVCSHPPAEIVGSNPAGGMDVCLL